MILKILNKTHKTKEKSAHSTIKILINSHSIKEKKDGIQLSQVRNVLVLKVRNNTSILLQKTESNNILKLMD